MAKTKKWLNALDSLQDGMENLNRRSEALGHTLFAIRRIAGKERSDQIANAVAKAWGIKEEVAIKQFSRRTKDGEPTDVIEFLAQIVFIVDDLLRGKNAAMKTADKKNKKIIRDEAHSLAAVQVCAVLAAYFLGGEADRKYVSAAAKRENKR